MSKVYLNGTRLKGSSISFPSCPDAVDQSSCYAHLAALKHYLEAFVDAIANGDGEEGMNFWDLMEVAQEIEDVMRLRNIVDLHLVHTLLTPAGVAASGTRSTAKFLVDRLGISYRDAKERVKAAELDGDIEPDNTHASLSPDGQANAPEQESLTAEEQAAEQEFSAQLQRQRAENAVAARAATARGELDIYARAVIRDQLRNLMPNGPMTGEDIKEKVYADIGDLTHSEVKARVRELVDESNDAIRTPEDIFADQRRRNLFISAPDQDGCSTIRGTLDAASSVMLAKLMGAYAKSGYGTPVEAADDKRTFGQLSADALTKILKDALAAFNGNNGNRGGLASIVAVADAADFTPTADGSNPWWSRKFNTNVGIPLNGPQLLRLGVSQNMLLSLIDTTEGVAPIDLQLFSAQRLADFHQRVALQILDGGCQHPGCDQPMDKCDIHHNLPFLMDGRTDIENLVPLCRVHHSQHDDTRRAKYRRHMSPRTADTNFRSGSIYVDGDGRAHPPEFNTGPTVRQAPGYVPPPGAMKAPKPGEKTKGFSFRRTQPKTPGKSSGKRPEEGPGKGTAG